MKKKFLIALLSIMCAFTLISCGSKKVDKTEELKSEIIGIWIRVEEEKYGDTLDDSYKMEIYKGGTVKRYWSEITLNDPGTWEIVDDVLNIKYTRNVSNKPNQVMMENMTIGYELINGQLVTMDGQYHYNKQQ